MILKVRDLLALSNVKNETDLYLRAKKDSILSKIAKEYKQKIDSRKKIALADYVNQKSQAIIKDNCFMIINEKFTTSKSFSDVFAIEKSEVLKLQSLKLTYESFKTLFKNVSRFILCNYNVKNNLAKHERFYSQCLAEVNLILKKKFTKEIIHSRSKKIQIKQITLDNVEKKFAKFMLELSNKTKAKTSKLIKANKKQTVKV